MWKRRPSPAGGAPRRPRLSLRSAVMLGAAGLALAAVPTVALIAAPSAAEKACRGPAAKGRLTFSQEFDAPLELPGEVFLTHYKAWGDLRTLMGNKEAEIYLDPRAARELGAAQPFQWRDGHLVIHAAPAPAAVKEKFGLDYTSGMITTEESFAQLYGVFEMRAKPPAGRGLWPAFWMVGKTHEAHYELDVVEILGHEPDVVYNSAQAPGETSFHEPARVKPAPDGFHTYSAEWRPDVICFRVDGQLTNAAPNKIHLPMYLIANLAVGGTWPGYPDKSTPMPAELPIDYIRAYELGAPQP